MNGEAMRITSADILSRVLRFVHSKPPKDRYVVPVEFYLVYQSAQHCANLVQRSAFDHIAETAGKRGDRFPRGSLPFRFFDRFPLSLQLLPLLLEIVEALLERVLRNPLVRV